MNRDELLKLFDYRDGKLIRKIKTSNCVNVGDVAGHVRADGYSSVFLNGKHEYTHRIVFLMMNGYLPKYIDHINGNPSDNRIENLREATFAQNVWNTKNRRSNTSGQKGISLCKQTGRWACKFWVNGKVLWLGRFDSFELAKSAMDEARKIHHGEFANSGDVI